jgi:hypothetical protein
MHFSVLWTVLFWSGFWQMQIQINSKPFFGSVSEIHYLKLKNILFKMSRFFQSKT